MPNKEPWSPATLDITYASLTAESPCSTMSVAAHAIAILSTRRRASASDEAVESVLGYQPPSLCAELDLSGRPLLQVKSTGIRPASEYDVLLQEEVPS